MPRPKYSLRFVSADYYYRIPVRPVYRTYPVYPIDKEPPGYLDKLRQKLPVMEFDTAKLKTREDWIRAGKLVFDSPITFEAPIRTDDVRDPGVSQPYRRAARIGRLHSRPAVCSSQKGPG